MSVLVKIYLNHELIRSEVRPLNNCVVNTELLGVEISKNALCPTELRVEVEAIHEGDR